jgi:glycosyltransferase involved in cell wall biosynthesis
MISVIVCTHNPRIEFLWRMLGALRTQTLSKENWELVLVDNASNDQLSDRIDVAWHPLSTWIREETLGLTPARLSGIRGSSGDVLVFVDDDNVLADDYLERVNEIAERHQYLGAWSGSVSPEFDVTPPEWTRRYWGNLVIRDITRDSWSNIYFLAETTPLGAGLCVRRNVANEYLRLHDSGLRARVLDRAGNSLASGGDNDLAACAIDIGLACGVMSSLRVTHLIPPQRLTEEYLLRLMEGVSYSAIILRSFRKETANSIVKKSVTGRAADVLRMARMSPRARRFLAAVTRGEKRARKELESS